jgi:hypothetical protein
MENSEIDKGANFFVGQEPSTCGDANPLTTVLKSCAPHMKSLKAFWGDSIAGRQPIMQFFTRFGVTPC